MLPKAVYGLVYYLTKLLILVFIIVVHSLGIVTDSQSSLSVHWKEKHNIEMICIIPNTIGPHVSSDNDRVYIFQYNTRYNLV